MHSKTRKQLKSCSDTPGRRSMSQGLRLNLGVRFIMAALPSEHYYLRPVYLITDKYRPWKVYRQVASRVLQIGSFLDTLPYLRCWTRVTIKLQHFFLSTYGVTETANTVVVLLVINSAGKSAHRHDFVRRNFLFHNTSPPVSAILTFSIFFTKYLDHSGRIVFVVHFNS